LLYNKVYNKSTTNRSRPSGAWLSFLQPPGRPHGNNYPAKTTAYGRRHDILGDNFAFFYTFPVTHRVSAYVPTSVQPAGSTTAAIYRWCRPGNRLCKYADDTVYIIISQCRQQNGRVEEWSQRAEQLNAFVGSQHDRRLLLSAGNCSNTSPAAIDIKAFSSKPAGCRCCSRSIGQTDGRTDRRTPDRYVDPVLHTMRPALTIFAATATTITMYQTLISK